MGSNSRLFLCYRDVPSLRRPCPPPTGWYYISQILATMTLLRLPRNVPLGSAFSNVGGRCSWWHHFLWKTTPLPCLPTLWMAEIKKKKCAKSEWHNEKREKKRKKLTSCDIQKNRGKKKTNSTKQLNGTKHNVLPLPNKRWLGYGPLQNNSVTLPGSGSAANSM